MPETEHTATAPVSVPVYAAGAGIPTLALDRLRDARWACYDDERGNVAYVSPDGCATARFSPEIPGLTLWRVAYENPNPFGKLQRAWTATFSDDTPAEAIAAFLTVLTDPAGSEIDR